MAGAADEVVGERAGEEEVDDGQRRCEVLAAFCLATSAAVVLHGIGRAAAYSRLDETITGALSPWQLVEIAAGSSSFYPLTANGPAALGTLVLAYLLVVAIGPGELVGAVGARVLQGLAAVGALLALGGAIATFGVVRQPGPIEGSAGFGGGFGPDGGDDALLSVVDRGSSALPMVAGAALAGYVAWCALRAVSDWRPGGGTTEPEADDDLDPYGADAG